MHDFSHGIVTAIRETQDPSVYSYNIVGSSVHKVKSGIKLDLYDTVSISGKMPADESEAVDESRFTIEGRANNDQYKAAMLSLARGLGIDAYESAMPTIRVGEFEKPSEAMLPKLRAAAKRMLFTYLSGAPVSVRYHNDCDGSSGAYALYRAMEGIRAKASLPMGDLVWRMNRSVAYNDDSFSSDYYFFTSYSSIERPLVFISDFGTAQESENQIRIARKGFNFVWIDHHPVYEGFPRDGLDMYINTWDYGGGSDFTAGYLTASFAELLQPGDYELLKRASLIGDHSSYADYSDVPASKLAIVLDYMTSVSSKTANVTPKQIGAVIDFPDRLEEAYVRANTLLSEALDAGYRNIKHHRSSLNAGVHVLDFTHVQRPDAAYPLPGRYCSRLHEEMERMNGTREITIVYFGSYISIRVSDELAPGLKLLHLLDQIKAESEFVYSCGGHEAAASIKVDMVGMHEVIRMLLKALGVAI